MRRNQHRQRAFSAHLPGLMAIAVLYGCVITPEAFKAQVDSQVPNPMVAQKLPLRVALVIPESSRTRSRIDRLPSPCQGALPEWPYGDVFVKTTEELFSKLYERVDLLRDRPSGGDQEAVFEAELTGLGVAPACPMQPNATYKAEGALRAVDRHGAELWRSRITAHTLQTKGITSEVASTREAIFGAIKILAVDWIQEIQSVPTERYARTSGREKAVPLPSSQPMPPPIY